MLTWEISTFVSSIKVENPHGLGLTVFSPVALFNAGQAVPATTNITTFQKLGAEYGDFKVVSKMPWKVGD